VVVRLLSTRFLREGWWGKRLFEPL
jgi:hypothetical protein